MRKLKPNYNPETVQGELVEKVCEYFGRVYDDFEEERHLALRGRRVGDPKREELMKGDPTINEVAEEFSMATAKVRKILITGGCYDTEFYRNVIEMREEGMTIGEIAEATGKKPITIRSYLPYERVIYKMKERSVNADRLVRFKKRWGGYRKK